MTQAELSGLYSGQTTYFSNWVEDIEKLPESFWSIFWLTEYDEERERKAEEEEQN